MIRQHSELREVPNYRYMLQIPGKPYIAENKTKYFWPCDPRIDTGEQPAPSHPGTDDAPRTGIVNGRRPSSVLFRFVQNLNT